MENEEENDEHPRARSPEVWNPWPHVAPLVAPAVAPAPVALKSQPSPEWDIAEVVKAAQLLWKPPKETNFVDEQEMRRVYSLIYDVFRYKTVLNQALDDVRFFLEHPQHAPHKHVVWLFVMDLARRGWGARSRDAAERASTILVEAGFKAIENDVWRQRVHFAAAVARIRIKKKAFVMSDLLPPHLREERVATCVNNDCITGWVNMAKIKNVNNLIRRLKDLGYTYSSSKQLCAMEYRFDRVCARFITFRPPPKTSIGENVLVKEGCIILQEREFCEGASVLCRALRASSLRGHVAQTHATSPRSTAYLAGQLRELAAIARPRHCGATGKAQVTSSSPDIGRLYVFGAGEHATQYVRSLRDMGIEATVAPHLSGAVCVLCEHVHTDHPYVSAALDGVVAALATPPNSYSAVTDPIDLVCGRGGDLAMLEVLTESEIDGEGKKRVTSILEEQKKTLKFLMSKPQIQMVLYETHSALDAENEAMVRRAVSESNRVVREKHSLLNRRKQPQSQADSVAFSARTVGHSTAKFPNEADAASTSLTFGENFDQLSERTTICSQRQPLGKSAHFTKPPINLVKSQKTNPIPEGYRASDYNLPEIYEPRSMIASVKDPDDDCSDVYVPKCDLFEMRRLPTLGNGLDINSILERDGCYLGLIQRKV